MRGTRAHQKKEVLTMLIKKSRWWLGYALIRLGWRIYLRKSDFVNDFCKGAGIEKNGIEYSIRFAGKERGGEK